MPNGFNPGDVVRLKSGGPIMTVDKDNGAGKLWCIWFVSGTEEPKSSLFPPDTLEKVTLPNG